jgi:hypothetical protein
VRRYEAATGNLALLAATGQTFEALAVIRRPTGSTPIEFASWRKLSCYVRRLGIDQGRQGDLSATPTSGAGKRATEARASIAIEKARAASRLRALTREERNSSRSPSARDGQGRNKMLPIDRKELFGGFALVVGHPRTIAAMRTNQEYRRHSISP